MSLAWRPLFLLTALSFATAARAGDGFLTEIEDLPLAKGLVEAAGGVLFDTADGRIVEASAAGEVDAAQVRQFYTETLPQRGWKLIGDLTFRRENEVLHVVIDDKKRTVVVRYSLAPHRNDG